MQSTTRVLLPLLLVPLFAASSGAATFILDATNDAGDANPGDGICDSVLAGVDCTLRAAVQEANALAGADRIEIPILTLDLTIGGSDDDALLGDLDLTDSVEIVGALQSGSRIRSAVDGERVLHVLPGVAVTLSSLTLEHSNNEGTSLDGDDGLLNQGVLQIDDVNLAGADIAIRNEGSLTASRLGFELAEETIAMEMRGDVAPGARAFIGRSELGPLPSAPFDAFLLMTLWGDAEIRFANSVLDRVILQEISAFSGRILVSASTISLPLDSFGFCSPMAMPAAEVEGSFVTDSAFSCEQCDDGNIVSRGFNVFDNECAAAAASDVTFGSASDLPDHVVASRCPVFDFDGNPRRVEDGWCDAGELEQVVTGPMCSNGVDDDGDGFVDLQDPGCREASDPGEAHLRPGDFVLSNSERGGTTLFDPDSSRLAPITRASGLFEPWDVLVGSDGAILVSDASFDALTRVDPEELSEALVSASGAMSEPTGLARDPGGDVFSAQNLSDDLLAIDSATGAQSLLLNDPSITDVDDLLLDPADGSLLVSDPSNGLFRITDPLGSPSVSSFSTSVVQQSRQIVFDDATGDLILADDGLNAPIRFDPDTGTDTAMLTTSPFTSLQGAGAEASGLFVFADFDTGLISRVDETADTATPLNVGRAEPGLRHMASVPDEYDLMLTLDDVLVADGGTPGVADPGDTLELTAVVTNTGAATADLLSLESGLDPNLTLVAGSLATSQGAIVEGSLASDPRLAVDLGSLGPAASATVTWEVDVADPAPGRAVTANAWIRREKLILAESDDPSTGSSPDPNVIGVGDYGIVVQAVQKISDTRGRLSGPGNPGSVLGEGGFFGGALESLGDLDGDGVEDVAVGAYRDSEGGAPGYGAFFILLLEEDGTVKERFKWSAASPDLAAAVAASNFAVPLDEDQLGSSIAWLGDLDGAGPADFALAVGAWYSDGLTGVDEGAVYIVFMDQSPLQVLSVVRIGDALGGFLPAGQLEQFGYFGWDIENIGDVDGDGVTDLAVGQHLRDDPSLGVDAGGVWILFLNADGTVKSSPAPKLLTPPSPGAGDYFGLGIAALGLFDGDGVPDLAVSATRRDGDGLTDAGAVFVTTLNADGTVKTQTEISSGIGGLPSGLLEDDDRFGRGLEAIPDLDGDGTVELVVGANRDADVGFRTGAAYALFLTPSGTTDRVVQLAPQPGVLFHELQNDDRFGISIAPLGDLDANGAPEIAVGVLLDDDGASNAGAVYVLHTATPLPEPGALLGLASGLVLLAGLGRRRWRAGLGCGATS